MYPWKKKNLEKKDEKKLQIKYIFLPFPFGVNH